MAPPSYARATLSSEQRGSPKVSKLEDPSTPQSTPRKLKRPSTLSLEDRQHLSYNADLYHFVKKEPSRPCILAELPSEIRTTIYAYVLQPPGSTSHPQRKYSVRRNEPFHYIWPSLLHVCRAIRVEAAYTYYVHTPFIFNVTHFEFSVVRRWVEMLSSSHRALLARNQQITVNVEMAWRRTWNFTYRYPPEDFMFGAPMGDHWRACSRFGNIYHVKDTHRVKFILFCRLATWWLWCSQPAHRNIKWNYTFGAEIPLGTRGMEEHVSRDGLVKFVKRRAMCFGVRPVARAWTGRTPERNMVPGALSFLSALESKLEIAFMQDDSNPEEIIQVRKVLQRLRKVVAGWETGQRLWTYALNPF